MSTRTMKQNSRPGKYDDFRPVNISASGMPLRLPSENILESIGQLRRNWSYPESPFLLNATGVGYQLGRHVSNAGSLKATLREDRLMVSVVKEGDLSIESQFER